MMAKVLSVVKSKAALAVLGVALVGGGTVAAFAATGHQLPITSTNANGAAKPDTSHGAGKKHGHTVSIEGVLKGYSGGTISVQSKDGTSTTITVNASTRINGDQVSALGDLAKNIGHKVEVQADKQSGGKLVAWKVTVEGATGEASARGSSNGTRDSSNGKSHSRRNESRVSA